MSLRDDIRTIVDYSVELTNEPRYQSVEPRIQAAIILAAAILELSRAISKAIENIQ